MSNDESDGIANFRVDAAELLAELDDSLLQLEKTPDDKSLVDKIFRALHTIKGTSSMVGLDDISSFTHQLETEFDKIRRGLAKADRGIIDSVLAAADQIKKMLEAGSESGEASLDARKKIIDDFRQRIKGTSRDEDLEKQTLVDLIEEIDLTLEILRRNPNSEIAAFELLGKMKEIQIVSERLGHAEVVEFVQQFEQAFDVLLARRITPISTDLIKVAKRGKKQIEKMLSVATTAVSESFDPNDIISSLNEPIEILSDLKKVLPSDIDFSVSSGKDFSAMNSSDEQREHFSRIRNMAELYKALECRQNFKPVWDKALESKKLEIPLEKLREGLNIITDFEKNFLKSASKGAQSINEFMRNILKVKSWFKELGVVEGPASARRLALAFVKDEQVWEDLETRLFFAGYLSERVLPENLKSVPVVLRSPDLIFVEDVFSRSNIIRFVSNIRKCHVFKTVPTVLITEVAETIDTRKATEAGINWVLPKPLTTDTFEKLLKS
ncbi:MAG: Hpt domain-containing protein [Candidatus Riflebacteria bacterium]|nr:Hpt domain-containing protein [Candidatus Riflebacteria bacterium]